MSDIDELRAELQLLVGSWSQGSDIGRVYAAELSAILRAHEPVDNTRPCGHPWCTPTACVHDRHIPGCGFQPDDDGAMHRTCCDAIRWPGDGLCSCVFSCQHNVVTMVPPQMRGHD